MTFKELDVGVDYSGPGQEILRQFILPLLRSSKRYDRITSFFTVGALLAIAEGLDALRLNRGRMRLIIGIHDIPEELAEAASRSGDAIQALIDGIRQRLLAEVTTIRSELHAQQLACIAWLLHDGLLEVRVAAPDVSQTGMRGLFHNKAFIFEDEAGDVVAGVGSANETISGLGANFEQLAAFTSWQYPEHTDAQVRNFERLWVNDIPGVSVRRLDGRFAQELLDALPQSLRRPAVSLRTSDLLSVAAAMEPLALVSGRYSALFPHQERAFLDALSRWPVRVLLADEVGLGKTFETAAVVKHLLTFTSAKSAVLLVPKAVLRQWQDELTEHFDIEAWIFESATRTFVSPSGKRRQLAAGEPVLGRSTPPIVLISAQYARGSRAGGSVAAGATVWPDILVVDEAHAARLRADTAGSVRPTLMWRLLDRMVKHVPHVIFATATPMQVHWREYHGLLDLLGLPEAWRSAENYEKSLRLISDGAPPALQDAMTISELIRSSLSDMRPSLGRLSEQERALVSRLMAAGPNALDAAMMVFERWGLARGALVKLHPAHLLTVRNTRSALSAVGYSFPERNLSAPTLDVSPAVVRFYDVVERYLSSVYFSVERECFPDRKFNVGFVRSGYQQRLASSLHACRLSLQRRRGRVQELLNSAADLTGLAEEVDDLAEAEVFEDGEAFEVGSQAGQRPDSASVSRAARLEVQWITDLLGLLEGIMVRERDPKLECAITLLRKHLAAGDRVLVFSRYTDTLEAVMSACLTGSAPLEQAYGVYTGQACRIGRGASANDCSRSELKAALDRGDISVVFCSEAASEGLNLQAARVLINVDVPWNPARLEQRIGRIARLGQRSPTVDVYNLWYPNSVEAKMYQRLLQRRDLYELAVGEFPEVVGAAIRDAIASRYGGQDTGADPIAELQRLRNSAQLRALKELWEQNVPGPTRTRRFREELANLVVDQAQRDGHPIVTTGARTTVGEGAAAATFTLEAGEDGTISLTHPVLSYLSSSLCDPGPALLSLWNADAPHLFAVRDGAAILPLLPAALPSLVKELIDRTDLSPLSRDPNRVLHDLDDLQLSRWLPNANALSIPIQDECPTPPRVPRSIESLSIRTAVGGALGQ